MPTTEGLTILELDGCPDFTPDYVSPRRDAYTDAMLNLLEWSDGDGRGVGPAAFDWSAASANGTAAGAVPS